MFDPTLPPNPSRAATDAGVGAAVTAPQGQVSSEITQPAMSHADALPAGTKLGEFEILSLLGVGGFGMVYRAYDHSLHRTVAIKEYMPSAMAGRSQGLTVATRSSTDQQTLVTGLRSFVSEARLLAQFDHPSLVKVYRFWEDNNTAYMSMPLYRGLTLRQARAMLLSPPSEEWLRTVLWAILGALKYLHEHNIVHRDVSPDNIFLQELGPPVLLDLGAARRTISDASHKHTAILKVNYAPIEQYAGAGDMRQGPWTDLYSIAAVIHGTLCNEPPPPATFRVLRDRMPTFASVAKTVESHFGQSYSPEFVATIEHAMAIQPQNRPQSVQEFSEEMQLNPPKDIQRFAWSFGLPVIPPPATVTVPQPVSKKSETTFADTQLTVDMSEVPERTVLMVPGARDTRPGALSGALAVANQQPIDLLEDLPPVSDLDFPSVGEAARTPVAVRLAGKRRKKESVKPGKWVVAALGCVALLALGLWKLNSPNTELAAKNAPMPTQISEVPVAGAGSETAAGTRAAIEPTSAGSAALAAANASLPGASGPGVTSTGDAKPALQASGAGATGAGAGSGAVALSAAPVAPAAIKRPVVVAAKTGIAVNAVSRPEASGTASNPAAPVATKEPEARPEPVVAVAPARPAATVAARQGPQETCANVGFLAKPMCVFNECEKPEFSRLAFCVANRKSLQDTSRSQQQ